MGPHRTRLTFVALATCTFTLTTLSAAAAPPPIRGNPGVPGLLAQIAELEAEVDVLEAEVATLQLEVTDLEAQVASGEIDIAELGQQLADADAEITSLTTELSTAIADLDELDAENAELVLELGAVELALAELTVTLQTLETQALVPRTGQQTCRDMDGQPIACAGTGQDGELRKGVVWPAPRLVDNGDGTVTDQLTGLVWLRQTHCIARLDWESALWVAGMLAEGACELSDGSVQGQWRLPNARELHSLVDFGQTIPALPANHPFVDVGSVSYWTSTAVAWPDPLPEWVIADPDEAWAVSFTSGQLYGPPTDTELYVWPVRDP